MILNQFENLIFKKISLFSFHQNLSLKPYFWIQLFEEFNLLFYWNSFNLKEF